MKFISREDLPDFPLADSPRGPVRALEAPCSSHKRTKPIIKNQARPWFWAASASPSLYPGRLGTVAPRGGRRGRGDSHQRPPFLCNFRFIEGGFVEKPKQGRRCPGRQGCQPRGQTVEAQSTGRGQGDPLPPPLQGQVSWGPQLSSHSRETSASHTFRSSGVEFSPKTSWGLRTPGLCRKSWKPLGSLRG